MKKDNLVYLRHALDAAQKIEEYLAGMNLVDFYKTTLTQDGVIRQIEIIGEAIKQVSKDLKEKYPQIPWQDIARMRDKLIHHYFGVDIEKVWLTVKEDLPVLKKELERILKERK